MIRELREASGKAVPDGATGDPDLAGDIVGMHGGACALDNPTGGGAAVAGVNSYVGIAPFRQ
jgi:hypothetical protein